MKQQMTVIKKDHNKKWRATTVFTITTHPKETEYEVVTRLNAAGYIVSHATYHEVTDRDVSLGINYKITHWEMDFPVLQLGQEKARATEKTVTAMHKEAIELFRKKMELVEVVAKTVALIVRDHKPENLEQFYDKVKADMATVEM